MPTHPQIFFFNNFFCETNKQTKSIGQDPHGHFFMADFLLKPQFMKVNLQDENLLMHTHVSLNLIIKAHQNDQEKCILLFLFKFS